MILTDREIQSAINCKQICITPPPGPTAYSSTSLDLTLDCKGRVWSLTPGLSIRPGAREYSYKNLIKLQDEVNIDGYQLEPHKLLLAWTREEIELPSQSRIAARVEGKSSLARLGIGVHVTAPTIHAGFKGVIQLEMINFAGHPIILDAGIKICQIIFEQTFGTPEKGYQGMFLGQTAS